MDYSRIFRSDPQPNFSQNVNYNVPTKKLFLNSEQCPVKYSKRKNQYHRPKSKIEKFCSKNFLILFLDNIRNTEIFNDTFREYRIDNRVNENKITSTLPAVIDENLIKQDLHRNQTNKKPSSLYENFIRSATKKDTKCEKIDTLQINLSSLSLSSNETASVSSIENFKNYRSNFFENNSNLKKSHSFGNSK